MHFGGEYVRVVVRNEIQALGLVGIKHEFKFRCERVTH